MQLNCYFCSLNFAWNIEFLYSILILLNRKFKIMKMKQLFFGVLLSLHLIGYSQDGKKEVLFTIVYRV